MNKMKSFPRAAWLILAIQLVMLILEAYTFQIEDMTLSKGPRYDFNDGWVMIRENGEQENIEKIPYTGESSPGEWIVIENTIPLEYRGMTLYFLSADKQLRVFIDGEEVYEFGMSDKRTFGHTPGSIVNFVDIPSDMQEGKIRIEMVSPYNDYAAVITKMAVADRDVAILWLLESNLLNLVCCVLILMSAVVMVLLSAVERFSSQSTHGMIFLSLFCLDAAVYYFIETKILSVFYGNQTLYSMLVFMCLMQMPLLLMLYYERSRMGGYSSRYKVLFTVICANAFIQLVLQALDIMDFMEMVVVSHVLIFLTVIFIVTSFVKAAKETKEISVRLGIFALSCMMAGSICDIIRSYIWKVGDMGKYGRIGTAIFALTMVIVHIVYLSKSYAASVEERAVLLKRDVENANRQKEELQRAKDIAEAAKSEALAASEAKGRFLAHMSHEIRTPIHAVLGMDEMILRESKESFTREYATDIYSAGQTLLSLINDILDFSKIESGKMEIIPVEYDICSVIHDLVNMISMRAKAKELELKVSVDENLPSRLKGDDVRIRQILMNLLTNAVKYTNEGTVSLSVQGRVEGVFVILHFEVEDTGIGIKEEDLPKLFVEFERIEENRNRHVEGTGLGMNITSQLLRLMDSRLMVESVYGKGSKFYFDLRQQIIDDKPVGDFDQRIQNLGYSEQKVSFYAPEAKILVVDDNAINRKVLRSLLKQNQVQVFEAGSGQECLNMVQKQKFHLIFLDHMMPEMDGVETLHRMQMLETYPCKDTPVIALTANAVVGARERYLHDGFDDFLSKPILSGKLEQMILSWLPKELVYEEAAQSSKQQEVSAEPEGIEDLPVVEGIDWNYTWLHLPDMALLEYTVKEFYKMLEDSADELEELYGCIDEEGGLDNYRVRVHGMKSASALIGAVPLAGMAKILEFAAKDGNVERIRALTPVFLEEWRSYKDKLKGVFKEDSEKKPIEEEDITAISALLETVRIGMEEMDIDAADEAMKQLKQYDYSDEAAQKIEILDGAVQNLDSEAVAAVIAEIVQKIKEGVL